MIEILQDVSKGNRCGNGWKGPVWQRVADSLEDQLKNCRACKLKFVRLKKDYREVKHLLDRSGFGWDYERSLATADDNVWDPILQLGLAAL